MKLKNTANIILASLLFTSIAFGQINIDPNVLSQKGISKLKNADSTEQIKQFDFNNSQRILNSVAPLKHDLNTYSYNPKENSSSRKDYLNSFTKDDSKAAKRALNNIKTDSLKLIKTDTDYLGFTHSRYRQYYKGIEVDGATIIMHEKEGKVTHINGDYYKGLEIDILPTITVEMALENAVQYLKISKEQATELDKPQLIISPINGIYTLSNFRLCYKFAIAITSKNEFCNIYIDAHSGDFVNKISNINNATAIGTATTLYSGVQSIATEYANGKYLLRDNTRNIYTYDGSNDTTSILSMIELKPLLSQKDFTDDDNNWQAGYFLESITINSIAKSWWYTFLSDETPDLYIKIFDGNNNLVYQSSPISNTNPTVPFNGINVLLFNPPYRLELWDYDVTSQDDFGGQYNINLQTGDVLFSGNGNTGHIKISNIGHVATDVHWGLIKTFDYFKNNFGRNSFDNLGSSIISFINPVTCDPSYGKSPNNARAYPPPYNFMEFGLGDRKEMSPFVGLDIAAHEFTHMVTNYTAKLAYQNESGAINEGFSDIFGTCVEFETKGINANWNIGEDVCITEPFFRSMANPKLTNDPNTYKGENWKSSVSNPNDTNDNGGVHSNSGVMNYWFYLLSEGGTGTNDNGNLYFVNGIGIENASKIAYLTLSSYLTSNSNFLNAYTESLYATEVLFGESSPEWWEVKQAWYAVGVVNTDPSKFCTGTVVLSEPSGTITDGSGNSDYAANSSCKWQIKPVGATSITINFTKFDTELNYDTLIVYSSIDADPTYVRLKATGSNLPSPIYINGGACVIEFKSDAYLNNSGWELNYTSTTVPVCNGYNILTNTTGSITDNSGLGNYGNNQTCIWTIAPPGAQTITLDVTAIDTEKDYDVLLIFDGEPDVENFTNLIGNFSGTNNPAPITAISGEMWVIFISDSFVTGAGFNAIYTAVNDPYCDEIALLTDDTGIFEDGSLGSPYYHNSNCGWLISPDDALSISLNFSEFDLEPQPEDGKMFYDYVEVFDGKNEEAPSLGKFAGSSIPKTITSTGGHMFVKFYTDMGGNMQGFKCYYSTITSTYCNQNTFTDLNGSFSDGSGDKLYGNNSLCSYLIQPSNADSIILTFSSFKTEKDADGVIIYDGTDTTAEQLGIFTGDIIPSSVIATSGAMYILFISDEGVRREGWHASYQTKEKISTRIIDIDMNSLILLLPNPTTGILNLTSYTKIYNISVYDVKGKLNKQFDLSSSILPFNTPNFIDITELQEGIYFIQFETDSGPIIKKIIKN